ncbi:hypothetical protein QYE76_071023 [Lolium multiflorum]|uniref:Uncharacterized protein n=1 Tax=Lolium multiflorum TaxID=4521 RepID=A0AAD8SKV8_LOLMU|nr:hypothetical protein QYE76_071023 [Lolium multiflorum]
MAAPAFFFLAFLALTVACAGERLDAGVDGRLPLTPPFAAPRQHLHAAAIGAIVLAAVIAVGAAAFMIFVCCCRHKSAAEIGVGGVRRADVELAPNRQGLLFLKRCSHAPASHGFMPSYNCWTKHGERGVIMEEDEEGDDFIDESYLAHFGDTFMEDAEGEGEGEEEARDDDPVDDLGRTIADARRRCETEKERENLDRMLEDHRKALYPGCDDGLKKLGCTLDLLRWKAHAGVADSAFENLLKMLKNMFPKNNELPAITYEEKKVVCPLGLEVLKIHACINDCILYRGEYENLNECRYAALRYKIEAMTQ